MFNSIRLKFKISASKAIIQRHLYGWPIPSDRSISKNEYSHNLITNFISGTAGIEVFNNEIHKANEYLLAMNAITSECVRCYYENDYVEANKLLLSFGFLFESIQSHKLVKTYLDSYLYDSIQGFFPEMAKDISNKLALKK